MKWDKESELAIKAATLGVEILDAIPKANPKLKTKESLRDAVTEKDLLIEKRITEFLLSASGHKIIGEESYDNEPVISSGPTWFIDPIDGTTNFISSIPLYAISVGIMDNFQFPVGAVIIPREKKLFYTFGKSAFVNDRVLHVNPCDFKDALVSCAFSGKSHHRDSLLRKKEYEFFGLINDTTMGCLRLGSAAINICYVATGRLQAAYGIANKIWDVAGALAIATKAGAVLHIEFIEGTPLVNYVVGAAGVAVKIAEMLKAENLSGFNRHERVVKSE